jgi:hypothetical protein
MKKLLIILLFIPLTLFSQETKEESSEPIFIVTTSEGEVIKAKKFRVNKKAKNIYIQRIDDKSVRFKSSDIESIRQGEKELLKKNNEKQEFTPFNYEFIETISYDEIRRTPFLRYRNILKVNEYKNKGGISFKVGDTIVIGKPSNKNNLEGNTVIKGFTNNNFSYIWLGSDFSVFFGGGETADETLKGEEGKIVAIEMIRRSNKEKYKPYLTMRKLNGRWYGIKRDANTNIDLAFESGEILKYGFTTRRQAINQLKEAKELLDLGLFTQEEYDELKKELTPIIMNKNN